MNAEKLISLGLRSGRQSHSPAPVCISSPSKS